MRSHALTPTRALALPDRTFKHISWTHVFVLQALGRITAPGAAGWGLVAQILAKHLAHAQAIAASMDHHTKPESRALFDAQVKEAAEEFRLAQKVLLPGEGIVAVQSAQRCLRQALALLGDDEGQAVPELAELLRSPAESPSLAHSFDGHPITVVEYQGRQIFFVDEIAEALGYSDSDTLADSIRRKWNTEMEEGEEYQVLTNGNIRAVERLRRMTPPVGRSQTLTDESDDASDVGPTPTRGGARKLVVLTEEGVHLVCIKTEKPAGKQLRRWLAREVLPAIRQTGSYQAEPAPAGPAPTALAPVAPGELAGVREELRALRGLVEGLRGQASSPRLPAADQLQRTPSHPLRSRPSLLWPAHAPEQLARFFTRWAAEIGCRRPLRSAELVDLAEECGLLSTEGCSALTATMRVGRILGGVLRADQPVAGFRLHRHHHGVRGNVFWLEAEQLALP